MLKNRILTAIILMTLTVAGILLLSPDGFALAWGIIILLAAYEWSQLSGLKTPLARFGFVAVIFAIILAARVFAMDWAPGELPAWFYWPVVAWWALWAVAFRKMPKQLLEWSYPLYARILAGVFVLVSGWVMMVWLRLNFTEHQVLYFVVLISLADVAAYFTGKNWGFGKLIPEISPGKTTEGVYGGVVAAIVLAVATGWLLGFEVMGITDFVFLSIITVAFSVCGDLFESLNKRIQGVKDSGHLLPGHGGILDRIDSHLAGISIFYVGSLLIPIFIQSSASLEAPIIMDPSVPPGIEAPAEGASDGHHFDPTAPMAVPDVHDDENPEAADVPETQKTPEDRPGAAIPESPEQPVEAPQPSGAH